MTRTGHPTWNGWHLVIGLGFGSVTTLIGVCRMMDPEWIAYRASVSFAAGILISWLVGQAIGVLVSAVREG